MKRPAEDGQERGKKPRGMTGLFSDIEVKTFFQRYIFVIVVLEVLIFLVCWVYQLGAAGHDRFGPVGRPFPWKTYFLIAFLTPVVMTFFLGVFVGAFNRFFYGAKTSQAEPLSSGKGGLARLMQAVVQIPFLVMLILLGVAAGLIYRIDEILYFFGHAGTAALRLFQVVGSVAVVCGTVAGIIWMVLAYKLKKRELEYRYKADVIERLAIPWDDLEAGRPVDFLPDPSATAPPAAGRREEESA